VLLQLARRALLRGARSLTLEVRMSNEPAKSLYRKFGFAPAGIRKNYYPEVNEDALVMWAHDTDSDDYARRLAAIEAELPSPSLVDG
jgi:ribosomal-protein-alanine N-acetyltransferase